MRHTQKSLILTSMLFLFSSLLFTSCYSWFEEKTPMKIDLDNTTLAGFFENETTEVELLAPIQLFASQGTNKDSIEISWSECQHATSYRIERAVVEKDENGYFTLPTEEDFSILEKYVYSTRYVDKILTNARYNNEEYNYLYFYRVSSDNISKGYESSPFTTSLDYLTKQYPNVTRFNVSSLSLDSGCGWLFAPPDGLDAWKGKSLSEIQLTWTGVPNARYYKIYRGKDSNGLNMEQIDSVFGNQTTYVNHISESDQGVDFYYKVCAQLANGSDSAFSSLALGFSLKTGAPTPPSNVRTIDSMGNSTSKITVTWDKLSLTDPAKTFTLSLYRSSSVDSVYELLKSNISLETTRYEDTSVQPDIYYYYYLQTIGTDNTTNEKFKSAFSESGPNDTAPAMGFILSPPSNLEVAESKISGNVKIIWKPALGSEYNTYKYSIYASQDIENSYSCVKEKIEPGNLNADGYYECEVEKQNFYKITTYLESSDTESSFSQIIAPCPEAPQNVNASKNKKIDGADFISNSFGVYSVKITWEKPASDNPAGYHVYRSSKPDSGFKRITEEPLTVLSFVDKNETAKAGNFYYYKVVSLNVLGQGKYGNDPSKNKNARGYGALTADQWFREYNKTVMNSQKKLTLMHKANNLDKVGSETVYGDLSGSLYYNTDVGLNGAYITMTYTNYADYYANNTASDGYYFFINGNTNTDSNMSANGKMEKSTTSTGMYPGIAEYGNLQIKGGAAGGGYYEVTTKDLEGNIIFANQHVDWKVGEEGRK